ncbi:MAG: AAA family ATPase [Longilinea sp.]|nr:AAA family ATPase [Longilinea sp.]MCA1954458.1 AAA family ATPase [Anaerolinea sp.]
MLQRLYVHNFRCLENFELNLAGMPSALLIGKNGTGKSTIAAALQVLQSIARGTNRMRDLAAPEPLLSPKDFARGRADVPIRFEVEVLLDQALYKYVLALELPRGFHELRVLEEQLSVDDRPIFLRQQAQVTFYDIPQAKEVKFLVDWHLAALPIVQEQSVGALHLFKTWLSQMVILSPIPALMKGVSSGETLEPKRDGSNFAQWFLGVLSRYPASYTRIEKYLKDLMPDLLDFLNKPIGADAKNLQVRFAQNQALLQVEFDDLSDGEKCFFLAALVLAANYAYGPLFCFWDEPDSYLSLSEVGLFAMALRKAFEERGQILVTSHNPEIIRKFSDENTFILNRKTHLEPTQIRSLSELRPSGDLIQALTLGDLWE